MSRIPALVLLLALAACSAELPTSSATLRPGAAAASSNDSMEQPNFLEATPDAPSIANPVIQFWATKGIDRTVRMYYHAAAGRHDSVTFFSIRVRAKSLWRRPDGSAIANGDSVLITLTLADTTHLVVDCQPSGLLFDPKYPATIRLSFANATVDDDGGTTVTTTITQALAIWRHESADSPWLPVASHEIAEANEVEGDIGGFTGYALAW